jgi:hypothetical protein
MLLAEDFESGGLAADWVVNAYNANTNLKEKDGNHFLEILPINQPNVSTKSQTWKDYAFNFRFSMHQGWYGVNVRNSGTERDGITEFKQYAIILTSNNSISLEKQKGGTLGRQFESLISTGVEISQDTWHNMTVICLRNEISAYIDGLRVIDYIDENDPFEYGKIFWDAISGGPVYLDDVNIWALLP